MPVVNIPLSRLKKFMPAIAEGKIIDMLPFAGLDIEGIDDGILRVEYNPNRPDFSSDYGIFRALRGIMGIEMGLPKILVKKTSYSVTVDRQVRAIRPDIVALVATGGALDDLTIKQLIAMQEDLHEGLGRHRKKISIGLHNLDKIRFPVSYILAGPDYSFVPLGGSSPKSIKQILGETDTGKRYGHILEKFDRYPLVVDSSGNVLSFPPIINGDVTTVDKNTRNLFVEVTGTDGKVADDALAIVAMTLHDAGFRIGSTSIRRGKSKLVTPKLERSRITTDLRYINSLLGLELDRRQVVMCLQKSRLDAALSGGRVRCEIPRYRTDISDPIDIAEEVAMGFGIFNLEPTMPAFAGVGGKSALSGYFAAIRETLAGLGMLESLNFSLRSAEGQYGTFGRTAQDALGVNEPKSSEHEILRDSLVPSLLQSLSRNVHEEYPQKLFEIGKVFHRGPPLRENWSVAVAFAHTDAGYTEIKSAMQALLSSVFGISAETRAAASPFFVPGRSASILVDGDIVGAIGEILPFALEKVKLRVPASAFEIDLSSLLSLPQ